MLPATHLPSGQFPINPLESFPYYQGFMLKKETLSSLPKAHASEDVKMWGMFLRRLEGPAKWFLLPIL